MRRLHVSVSGGRTSGFMAKWIKDHKSHEYEIANVFANTGFEHPDTLRFVNDLDRYFGLDLVWVEAVVHPGRVGCTHRIVSYETASRNGEPFEAVVAKYGLPNQTYKFCTRELKLNPMLSYFRSIGWNKGDYDIAVGIRTDETRRVAKTAEAKDIVYPLIDWHPTDKQDVLAFFEDYEWNLAIPEHQGNCVTCFKKSDTKLNTLYREDPSNFEFFARLERDYAHLRTNDVLGPRKMFRGYRSTRDLLATFDAHDFDSRRMQGDGGCSESCELYPTTDITT